MTFSLRTFSQSCSAVATVAAAGVASASPLDGLSLVIGKVVSGRIQASAAPKSDSQAMPGMQHGDHPAAAAPQHEGHGQMDGMEGMGHSMSSMQGQFGPWSMTREGSGTSWLPDAAPMFMKDLPKIGRYDAMVMGLFTLNYTDAGGKRGDQQVYSNSMPMLMLRRQTQGTTLGLRIMASLDPLLNGEYGAPNLFQTGETAYGEPLRDRQHPHDLVSELAFTASRSIGGPNRGYVYLAPVGEPALGGSMFFMRPSGMEIPEAPIGHHWFDSTHISFGVATAGVSLGDRVKVEGSYFNGREPDENRYAFDPIRLNSGAARVSYNPTRRLSFNVAYGFLDEPEPATEPGVSQRRTTASAAYSSDLSNGDSLNLALIYGRNGYTGGQKATSALALEGTLYHGPTSLFARYEFTDKNEIEDVPSGVYPIHKLLLGATRNFASRGGLDFGYGGYVGVYGFPSSLDPFYGKTPVTFGLFLRIRPGRMNHGAMNGAGDKKDDDGMKGMPGMGG